MRRKTFTVVLTAFLLLALVILHSNVFAQESKPSPPKVVRLIVEEDYGETKGVSLPIYREVSGFLSRIGAKVVDESASTYDATLTVKIKGEALRAHYQPVGYLYTGARLSGEVVMEVGKEVHRFKLEGLKSPPSGISYLGEPPHREPSKAPFKSVLTIHSNFYTILSQIIGKVYSLAYVVDIMLKDSNDYFRQAAAEALGKMKEPRAVEPLIAALRDSNSDVRKATAYALDKLNWKPETVDEKVAYHIAKKEWEECVKIGAPAVEPLIAALKDQGRLVREGAAKALGEIKDPRAVKPLIAALKEAE